MSNKAKKIGRRNFGDDPFEDDDSPTAGGGLPSVFPNRNGSAQRSGSMAASSGGTILNNARRTGRRGNGCVMDEPTKLPDLYGKKQTGSRQGSIASDDLGMESDAATQWRYRKKKPPATHPGHFEGSRSQVGPLPKQIGRNTTDFDDGF